ncbi:hypothetical protein Y1Q_0018708 [Alligator mississippiensis]|uniref:Uncharacterized protein n=1 Tax=Alligator mississippiensis TaxID=8496 RepID=A0A151NS90_ALLMI|nr:hypothetical protein Y1Q_0018708 [Alligator mississippiensis]
MSATTRTASHWGGHLRSTGRSQKSQAYRKQQDRMLSYADCKVWPPQSSTVQLKDPKEDKKKWGDHIGLKWENN